MAVCSLARADEPTVSDDVAAIIGQLNEAAKRGATFYSQHANNQQTEKFTTDIQTLKSETAAAKADAAAAKAEAVAAKKLGEDNEKFMKKEAANVRGLGAAMVTIMNTLFAAPTADKAGEPKPADAAKKQKADGSWF
jgi:hypothetical protein